MHSKMNTFHLVTVFIICIVSRNEFLTSITRNNVVEDTELEAYAAIPEEERLSGQILSEALSTFGDTNTGAQMTDAELEKQVNRDL